MIQIANPIYDVVFRYLMNDEKVAKLLLSAIIGREVISLEFRPTEYQAHVPIGALLTVLRMDFSARIMDEHGRQELIILELQKAKLASDILRFRRYLGEQYSNKENVVQESQPETPYRKALPILSIYFLGHTLEHVKAPVVRVNRRYVDAATGEEIRAKEDFIESLTHDSIIIQIPYLKGRRRTELEQLLSLFDQSNVSKDNHFLIIDEEELPERYRPLLRRLQKAVADPELRKTMDTEDDIVEELRDYHRLLANKDKIIAERDQIIAKRDQIIENKDQIIENKDQIIENKDQIIENKDQIIENAVRKLFESGASEEQLATLFQRTIEEIKAVLSSRKN